MYVLADKNTMVDKLNNQIMFIIDNSASMYTTEQAIEKNLNGNATEDSFKDLQANDSEYKRLDIVSQLVTELDDEFQYGLIKFTADIKTLSQMGSNKEQIKNALERIKTEGEKFNGTYIGLSIHRAVDGFSEESGVNKYIVLISDGEDTTPSKGIIKGWAIDKAKDKNIKIITIGLGNEVDHEYLREYAEETGGMYYHADSANMLKNIYNNLSEKLNFGRTTLENKNGKEEDYLVVADSGFIPETNGFSFKNYRTSRRMGGQCFGMAKFCQQYYTDTLNMVDETTRKYNKVPINFNYDLTALEDFDKKVNLSNYKFKNEAFGKLMSTTDEEKLNYDKLKEDFNNGVKNLHVELKEEYKQYVEQTNGAIKIAQESDSKKGYGEFTYDVIYIDMDACTDENLELIPDLQVFKAIEFLYMTQFNEEGTNGQKGQKVMIDNINVLYDTVDRINDGDPVGISYLTHGNLLQLIFKRSNHAVNGIKVLRSVKNTNKYKIAIYNNSYPMETQYLDIEKVKTSLFGTTLCGYEQDGHFTNIFVQK